MASRKWSSPQPASDKDADHPLASLYPHSSIPLLQGYRTPLENLQPWIQKEADECVG